MPDYTVHEELLSLKALHNRIRGEDIYYSFTEIVNNFQLDSEKLVSVTTDGAPAMTGKNKGLAGLLSKDYPSLMFFHCIIHQQALCYQISDKRLDSVMSDVVKATNFIRARSSTTHRQFKEYLCEQRISYSLAEQRQSATPIFSVAASY